MVERGHEVEVFTTSIDGNADSSVPIKEPVDVDGVKVTYHRGAFPRRLFAAKGLRSSCQRRVDEFDLVHIHSMFLMPTRHAARACRNSGVPYVLAPRGMLDQELVRARSQWAKRVWIALFDRINIEHAAAVHFTSEAEKLAFAKMGLKSAKDWVLPNGLDIAVQARTAQTSPGGRKFGLYLGRLSWKKGLDVLLDAWAHIPDFELIIAGTDDENITPALRSRADKLGISRRVSFVGPVHGPYKLDLLQQAQVFVLPSRGENFGVAVLEAMAAGCPVVVSPDVGLASIIKAERCGRVVVADAEPLAQAIITLLGSPDESSAMGLRGAGVVRRKFTWSVIAEKAETGYLSLLSGLAGQTTA